MTDTPLYDAVVAAQGFDPDQVGSYSHQEFMARCAQTRRQARKVAAARAKRPGRKSTKKSPPKV